MLQQSICLRLQSTHVGFSRAEMVAIIHRLRVNRCGYYGDNTYQVLYIRYIYVSYINIA